MRYYKYILAFWMIAAGIMLIFRFAGNDEKKIKQVFENIRIEFSKPPSTNLIETATCILKILSNFSEKYSGILEQVRIDDERELRESVSYLVQSFSPVESGLQFERIEINKKKASVLLHVEIKNCRIPGALKNKYVFQISMIKDKGKWLIRSSDEIVY